MIESFNRNTVIMTFDFIRFTVSRVSHFTNAICNFDNPFPEWHHFFFFCLAVRLEKKVAPYGKGSSWLEIVHS